jgi:hypothetical protein
MIRFYTNKELSQKFNVNLARWKRWSREFLPPDPLGGLQSGYARQYSLDDAFSVVLGGHLVGDLKFSIPETKQILIDLNQWLVDHDFYLYLAKSSESAAKQNPRAHRYLIAIISRTNQHDKNFGLSYWIRGILAEDSANFHGERVRRQDFTESFIGPQEMEPFRTDIESYRVLNISGLHEDFLTRLQEQN